jgi:rubrerythrin
MMYKSQILNAKDLVSFAISIEEKGEMLYALLYSLAKNEIMRSGFDLLRQDEKRHIETFQSLQNSLNLIESKISEPIFEFTNTLVGDIIYTSQKRDELLYSVSDIDEAIEYAITIEKDSIMFFENLKNMVNDADKDMLNLVISEEKKHLGELVTMRASRPKEI